MSDLTLSELDDIMNPIRIEIFGPDVIWKPSILVKNPSWDMRYRVVLPNIVINIIITRKFSYNYLRLNLKVATQQRARDVISKRIKEMFIPDQINQSDHIIIRVKTDDYKRFYPE